MNIKYHGLLVIQKFIFICFTPRVRIRLKIYLFNTHTYIQGLSELLRDTYVGGSGRGRLKISKKKNLVTFLSPELRLGARAVFNFLF